MKKLTPSDIKKPSNKSGFAHVTSASPGPNAGGGYVERWRAVFKGAGSGQTHAYGPVRRLPVQAAQDYCDYVNGDPARLTLALKRTSNPKAARDPIDDGEVKAALGVLRDARAQRRKLPGFVYLITDGTAVKVGYSVKPQARVSELQTGNPRELRLLATKAGTEADEAAIHQQFMADNLLLEWFKPSAALYGVFGLQFPSDS